MRKNYTKCIKSNGKTDNLKTVTGMFKWTETGSPQL